MSGFRLPLALSLAAHAIILAVLFELPTPAPPLEPPLPAGGIEVALAPSLPEPTAPPPPPPPVKAETPPPPAETPPPPPTAALPPLPAIEPPAPAPEAIVAPPEPLPPPPPPRKPRIATLPKAVPRHVEREPTPPAFTARQPAPAPARLAPVAAPRTAFTPPAPAPAPAPSAAISPGYSALLSEWLESHKRYPESAREHGEEGRAVLRFVVEHSGRVAESAVAKSSGYPDLDAALEEMMRGATLPPFPAGMDQPSVEVSVTIRFSLAH